MKVTNSWLVLSIFSILISCKKTKLSTTPASTTFTFSSSAAYSFAGTGTYNRSFSASLPAASTPSIFALTQTGVLIAASQVEDNATGFAAFSALGQPADGSYTAGYSNAPSSSKRELVLFRSTSSNLELFSATRSSTNNASVFSLKTTIPSQASGVVSMAETADSEYILLVSGSGTTHKILKRGFTSNALNDTYSVTASAVGSTISSGKKALSANLNNSSDSGNDRNEYEFLLVGSTSVRVLIPSGNGLYADSAIITRSGSAEIVDAAMVRWDGDQYPDLLLLTASGLEYYKNSSASGALISFAAGRNLLSSTIDVGTPTRFLVADLNADQFQDLVIFRNGDSPLYLQTGSGLTLIDKTSIAFGSQLNSSFADASTGDFNGDNRIDISFFEVDGTVTTFLANN